MSLEKRIKAFVLLGEFLKQFPLNTKEAEVASINDLFYEEFKELILRQKSKNGWFEKDSVLLALNQISNSLTEESLRFWLSNYELKEIDKKVGVIMAGNIPLVGFHDFLSVLISGNTLIAKLSSADDSLLKKIGEIIVFIDPNFKPKIHFVEKLENFDAVIATGSNNSSRYFEYYFNKYPHIIRKNRNSVAIIQNHDSKENLEKLGNDIFQYFGLGCRNVSKIYFPTNFSIATFFEAIYDKFQNVVYNNKYANNYDYNKAVYLLGNNKLLDNGFLLLKEDKSFTSPVGVLHYEFYDDLDKLCGELISEKEEIQCVVASNDLPIKTYSFGDAQNPGLMDYADEIDTIKFLNSLI